MSKTPRRKPAGRSQVSLIIALLLVASAAVRLAGGTATAIAREVDTYLGTPEDAASEQPGRDSDEIDVVLRELSERQAALDRKDAALMERQRALDYLASETEKKLEQLRLAEQNLQEVMNVARTAAETDVSQLVSVYENMKPKDAAQIFEEMAPDFAAGFLARMRPESAALIVAGLEPNTAYSISVILAGRNLNVPTE